MPSPKHGTPLSHVQRLTFTSPFSSSYSRFSTSSSPLRTLLLLLLFSLPLLLLLPLLLFLLQIHLLLLGVPSDVHVLFLLYWTFSFSFPYPEAFSASFTGPKREATQDKRESKPCADFEPPPWPPTVVIEWGDQKYFSGGDHGVIRGDLGMIRPCRGYGHV